MNSVLYPGLARRVGRLKRREQVLAGIWAGKSTKEIAADLGVSPKTVEYHRACLYRLLGVQDLVSLCRRAMAMGLLDTEESNSRKRNKEGTGNPR